MDGAADLVEWLVEHTSSGEEGLFVALACGILSE